MYAGPGSREEVRFRFACGALVVSGGIRVLHGAVEIGDVYCADAILHPCWEGKVDNGLCGVPLCLQTCRADSRRSMLMARLAAVLGLGPRSD